MPATAAREIAAAPPAGGMIAASGKPHTELEAVVVFWDVCETIGAGSQRR